MADARSPGSFSIRPTFNKALVLVVLLWTAVCAGSLAYDAVDALKQIEHLASLAADENIDKDVLYRSWAAGHGGVYVPVTEATPPNPYLTHVRERDITTPSGRKLTLINPAYMTRQVHELGAARGSVMGHITSGRPIRSENAPDAWEQKALDAVAGGAKSFGEVVTMNGVEYYRRLRALYIEESCLACHAGQGYRLGDLRGGISASVRMDGFAGIERGHFLSSVKHFGAIWLLGLAAIAYSSSYLRRRIREKDEATERLEASEQRYRTIVDTALEGIVAVDGDAVITFTNRHMAGMLGYEPEEMQGRSIYEFIPRDEWGDHDLQLKFRKEGRATQYERKFLRRDGMELVTRASASPLMDESGVFCGAFGMFTDITDHKFAEDMLAANERTLSTIFEASQAGIILVDGQGVITFANQRMADLLRCPLDRVVGSAYTDHLHREQRSAGDAMMRQLISGERGSVSVERHYLRADGSDFWGFLSGRRLGDAKGDLVALVGIIADITERKLVEEALSASEEKYRYLFESNPVPMWVYDAETLAFLAVNDFAVEQYGYSREEFLQLTIRDIRPAEDLPRLYDILQKRTGAVRRHIYVRHRKKDGAVIDVEIAVHDMVFGDRPARLVHAIDITERRKWQQALVDSESRFRKLVEEAPFAIAIIDRGGAIEYVNRKHVQLIGYRQEEIATLRQWWNLVYPESGYRENIEREWKRMVDSVCSGAAQDQRFERRVRCKDGTARDLEVLLTPIAEKICVVFHDVTERKLAAEQRERLEAQLMQSQKIESIGRLAGGMAHDINNMLTPILGYADMLRIDIPEGNPGKNDIDEIVNAANRVKDMTQQLLAFARKQTLEMRPLDVNVVISRFGKMLHRTLREDIRIAMDLAPRAGNVLADERQLEQVILNLAVNAQDAMPQGGLLMMATRAVAVDPDFAASRPGMSPGPYLLIKVSDTGMGMDGETLARIFEPFYTTKESGRGTGLGLATVYGIVKQHKGYIEVTSEPRQGATFLVYLPVSEDAVEGEAGTMSEGPRQGSETVLVVEDQQEVLTLVKRALEMLGYRVVPARGGDEARSALREGCGDVELLITDVIMPGMNGRELYEVLKGTCPSLKVLYMSGYPAEVIGKQGSLDSGVNFLRKPFSVQELSVKVRDVLDGKEGGSADPRG